MSKLACAAPRAPKAEIEELETRVQSQLNGRVRDLQLVVQNDAIVLRGFARTFYAKQIAQQAVMRLTDRPILANEIEVF